MVLIFGKDTCPYTQAARDHYAARNVPFEYLNVKKNRRRPRADARLLEGVRQVPGDRRSRQGDDRVRRGT